MKVNKTAVKIGGCVLLVAALGIGGFVAYNYVTDQFAVYEEAIAMRDGKIGELQGLLDEIGAMTTVYELNYDVKGGTIIDETDLTPVQVPAKAASGYVQDINNVIGKYYKTALGKGNILGDSMVLDYELTGDLRYLDVAVDGMPIGLEVGDYVDVRFRFTFGQNFLAMSHKQVVEINKNVLKLVVDEKDIHTYESMQRDKDTYVGCKISAVEYIEGGIQKAGLNFYPARIESMSTLVQDPNVKEDEDLSQFNLVDRELLEEQLITQADLKGSGDTLEEEIKKIYAEAILSGEEELNSMYSDAAEYYAQVEAAKNLGEAVTGGSGSSINNDDISMAIP